MKFKGAQWSLAIDLDTYSCSVMDYNAFAAWQILKNNNESKQRNSWYKKYYRLQENARENIIQYKIIQKNGIQ